jgi:hypothetical protein
LDSSDDDSGGDSSDSGADGIPGHATRVAPSGRGPWSTIVSVNHCPGSRGRPFLWLEPREVVSFADEQASHSPTVTRLRHEVHLRPRAMQVRRSGHA